MTAAWKTLLFGYLLCNLMMCYESIPLLQNESLRTKLLSGLPFIETSANFSASRGEVMEKVYQIRQIQRDRDEIYKLRKRMPKKPRMGICIVGESVHLELTSKVINLIKPNAITYQIDIVLIIAPPRGNNDESGRRFRMSWSPATIQNYIQSRISTNDTRVFVDDSEQIRFPLVIKEYEDQLKLTKPKLTTARVQSHVRHWFANFQCWKKFSLLEESQPYSAMIKLRDDSFIFQPWIIGNDDKFQFKGRVLVPQCLGWGGLNEKVALLDAAHHIKDAYFAHVLYEYYFNFTSLKLNRGNPESVLNAVLDKYGINVVLAPIDIMPVYSISFETSDIPCFTFNKYKLGGHKKCHPRSCAVRRRMSCLRCTHAKYQQDGFSEEFFKNGETCEPSTCLKSDISYNLLLNLPMSKSTLKYTLTQSMQYQGNVAPLDHATQSSAMRDTVAKTTEVDPSTVRYLARRKRRQELRRKNNNEK